MNSQRLQHGRWFRGAVSTAAFSLLATPLWAQQLEDDEEGQIFVLAPFQVTTSERDIGYYSENTLIGSRLNTRVGDLAASITVVTRQQLDDTASVDINDVFLFEANTEGIHNYTPYHINRGWAKDEAAGHSRDSGQPETHATSNRIRGLAAADTSQNNYPTIRRMPFDVYNTQSVEISRGPNSLLFGLGSPAGIVNQSTATAALDVQHTEISAAITNLGGYRGSISHNQPLIEDTLAVFGALLYDKRKFERKSAEDTTDRQYGALTFKPFPRTFIRGSIERYSNFNQRPNYLTPRDFITPWIQAGRPVYNPNTRLVTLSDTGEVFGPYVLSPDSPGYIPGTMTNDQSLSQPELPANLGGGPNPLYVPGIAFIGSVQQIQFIDRDRFDWEQRFPGFGAPPAAERTPEQWMLFDRRLTQSAAPRAPVNPATGQPLMAPWYPSGITDKSIYNWHKVNTTSANFGEMDGRTYNLEFEQQILDDLFLQVGWFRQTLDTKENYTISQQQAATVFIDTNSHLIDGRPNPNFLSPYMEDYQADTFTNPERNNNYRAMLAYLLDFSDQDGWLQHLGRHRFLGMWSEQDVVNTRTRSRIAVVGGHPRFAPDPIPGGTWSFAQNNSNIRRYYYMGEDGVITRGTRPIGNPGPAGGGGPTSAEILAYDWDAGAFQLFPVELNTELFWAGTSRNQRVIDSRNVAWQGFLWDDRIIATLGWRKDYYKGRSSGGGPADAGIVNGRIQDPLVLLDNWGEWERLSGTTSTQGVVFRPLPWLSLHYNQSDNFNPPPSRQTDWYGNELGKPSGEGKDYGFGLNLFNDRLIARVNWFENSNENERGRVPTVFIDRTNRIDSTYFREWAEMVVRIRSGLDPEDPEFALDETGNVIPLTPAQEAEVEAITGLPYDFPAGLTIGATSSNSAKGMEIQVIYNPMPNWNMKFTAGKQETIYDNVAPQWDPWIADRMPVWTSATAPDMPETFFLRGTEREVSIRSFWEAYGYRGAEIVPDSINGWFNTGAYYDRVVQDEVDAIRSQEGLVAPGQRKWSANLISNYRFNEGPLQGWAVGGSLRWMDRNSIGNFGIVDPDGVMRRGDPNRPIMGKSETNVDLWVSYTRMIHNDSIRMQIQLNVRDVFESGGLQPIAANFDGSPFAYRIIDPRMFTLTTRFSF
ncbi:MAG: hypothetical protein EA425_10460 [Puniceicoccaceae bacterium]|nr:MAG: hypothetical protein EA425_10460 [Puniceicoccaceae bacterium]